jgi:hypothetical protein
MLILVGAILMALRAGLPSRRDAAFELAVSLTLITLGVRALLLARRASRADEASPRRPPGGWRAVGPLAMEMIHRLAGSGTLTALVMPRLPSALAGVVFMAVFGLATLGMALHAGAASIPLRASFAFVGECRASVAEELRFHRSGVARQTRSDAGPISAAPWLQQPGCMGYGLALWYLCAIGGLVMITGSIVLLALRKTFIDSETKQPITFDIPMIGKMSANSPAIVLFGIGIVPLIFSVWDYHRFREKLGEKLADKVHIVGTVTTDSQEVRVYAVQAVDSFEQPSSRGMAEHRFRLDVPLLVGNYDVYFMAQNLTQNGNALVYVDHTAVSNLDQKNPGEFVEIEGKVLPSLSAANTRLLAHPNEGVRYATNVAATPLPEH